MYALSGSRLSPGTPRHGGEVRAVQYNQVVQKRAGQEELPVGREIAVAQPQTKDAPIRLYTGDYCPFCRRVKKELDRLNLPYEEVYADADGREEVIKLSGQRAIPILTIGDEVFVDSSHIIRELRKRFVA
jgi:glutaredoxin 3